MKGLEEIIFRVYLVLGVVAIKTRQFLKLNAWDTGLSTLEDLIILLNVLEVFYIETELKECLSICIHVF
jgi:hypothetical protein